MLERAVMAEDDVEHRLGELRREPVESLDRPADAVVAEHDLALKSALVGHRDRAAPNLVGVELADVVEQRAGDRDVPVDATEHGRDRADRLGDRQRVLEQAVAIGVVVALARGRLPVSGPRLAEDRGEKPTQVRALDRAEQLAQVALHLLDVMGRAIVQVGMGVLAVTGLPEAQHVEIRAGERPGHEHDVAGPAGLAGVASDDGRHGPAPVLEDELELFGVTVDLAHEEGLRDVTSFCKFPNSHPWRR